MKIKQEDNGNIVITGNNGEILHILPSMYIHQHPRKKNAILITDSIIGTKESLGISILASNIKVINDQFFNGNVENLKNFINKEISVSGVLPPPKQEPLTKENDPNYVAYLQANTFEKMLAFVKENKSNVGGVTIRNGKVMEEEFLCQFQTFIIRVTLSYIYRTDTPNLINYIHMYGSTSHVFKTKKVYQYDSENNITGFVYQEII